MASTTDAKVDAVPMVMQVPELRDIPLSAAMKSLSCISPARTASLNFQTSVPEPISAPQKLAVQHRTGRHDDRRQIDARCAHQLAGCGLVASAQQNDGVVDRIATNGFLDLHRQQVAEQHCRRTHLRFAQRHRGEFERCRRPPRRRVLHIRRDHEDGCCRAWSSDQVLQMPITGRPSKTLLGKRLRSSSSCDE